MATASLWLLASFVGAEHKVVGGVTILFVGDNGHHRPKDRFAQLQPVMQSRGISLTYTDNLADLNPRNLAQYQGVMIYANHERIAKEQEKALVDYVEAGHGLIPLHCATYCFLNSPQYITMVGAQFQRHGTGVFRTTVTKPDHPIMKGYQAFESWDETYVHHRHNPENRIVLETRNQGAEKEPWTWVRTQGKGRVFYTAWGHDERTWSHPGFQNLVERGVRWAVGEDPTTVAAYVDKPEMRKIPSNLKAFEMQPAKLPFYPAGQRWGTVGEPISEAQKPLSPEESMKHISTPVEFEPQLFAAEPQIGKPIAMAFDERGRVWIAETVDYPNELQPPGQGRDRIRICEDTDGDGKADKFTIFADKLSIPTSMAFANGGLIVHQAPDTLFLKDTNGDDVCDERKVLFTGWRTNDTHAGPSNLVAGLDNWMYGIVGYAGFNGEVGGERHRFAQGLYRFKADGSKMEFLRNTNNNSWGVGITEDGHLFGSTANGCPSVYCGIPNRYYERVRGWSSSVLPMIASSNKIDPIRKEIRQVDHHGGFTAGSGHAIYTARTYPQYYWNRTAFVSEPTGSLTATFQIYPQGAGFRTHNSWNLFVSDDEWTAPIIAEVGPDGSVWVVDWYNIVVQHNPTPVGFKTGKGAAYETPLRDKKYGRIYRVALAGSKPTKPLSLKDATPQQLVETLKHPNKLYRQHAQRLLVERGKCEIEVERALMELIEDKSVDPVGLNVGAIHAIWTLQGLGRLQEPALNETKVALFWAHEHPSPAVRSNLLKATTAAVDGKQPAKAPVSPIKDANPQVKLAAMLAAADSPASSETAAELAKLASDLNALRDPLLVDGLIAAAAKNDAAFLSGVLTADKSAPGAERVVAVVAEHFARNGSPGVEALVADLAKSPSPLRTAVVASLARGWPKDKTVALGVAGEQALVDLFDKLPGSAKSNAITLAGKLGSKSLEGQAQKVAGLLAKTVGDSAAKEADRIAAATQLTQFLKTDDKAAASILAALDARTSPELANGLLAAFAQSESSAAGAKLAGQLPTLTPSARERALVVLLSRPEWTKALLASVEKGKASWNDFTLDQKQALAVHPDADVKALATKLLASGGALPNADRQKVLTQLAFLETKKGDPVHGKAVYKKHCAVCHKHSGEGGNVGPDLTGMAVHPKHELLVHLLDPSRSVEGNFRAFTVATLDGRVVTGLMASESKTAIELVDAQAKKVTILREDVEQLIASNKSLMPEGFEKQCTPDELANLLEYLTQKGKYVPLDLSKVATVTTFKGMFYGEEILGERMLMRDWAPRTVEGVPFAFLDPQEGRARNAILLYGPIGQVPPKMPRSVKLPCNMPLKAVHLLSGVSGWGFPASRRGSTSMIVRFHYADGQTEDHRLVNGEHFADYINRTDVPGSKYAFGMSGKQVRYLAVTPNKPAPIKEIELVKGRDQTAPIVMAATLEPGG